MKIVTVGLQALSEDFDLPERLGLEHERWRAIGEIKHLQAVKQSLEMSAEALRKHPTQLLAQLVGRLKTSHDDRIQAFLRFAKGHAPRPTLLPRRASLAPIEGAERQILHAHTDSPYASIPMTRRLALSADGRIAIFSSRDDTLRVSAR